MRHMGDIVKMNASYSLIIVSVTGRLWVWIRFVQDDKADEGDI